MSVKKVAIVLLVANVTVAGVFFLLGVPFGPQSVLMPLYSFVFFVLGIGVDKKPEDSQSVFDLRIKVGARWLSAALGAFMAMSSIYISIMIFIPVNYSEANAEKLVIIFVAFIIFFIVPIWLVWQTLFTAMLRVRYNDAHIIATTLLFKPREHHWSDLLKIKDMHFSNGKRLIFRNTGTVRIEENLEGSDDLMEHANKVLADA